MAIGGSDNLDGEVKNLAVEGSKVDEEAPAEIEVEAESLDEAIRLAAKRLNCPRKGVRYAEIQKASSGFLGFGSQPARIRAWFHDNVSSAVAAALAEVGDLDGHFIVELSGQDINLTVHPPVGVGNAADTLKMIDAINEYQPDEIDQDAVVRASMEMDGRPVKVGFLRFPADRDGTFLISVSPDRLSAEVSLIPAKRGGRETTVESVIAGLAKAGIVFGVNAAVVKQAIEESRYNTALKVARGIPPKDGEHGEVAYSFQPDRARISFKENESGRVDFRELNLIENVKRETLLARLLPPSPGKPGTDVSGRPISASDGSPAVLPTGDNTYVDGVALKAAIDGHVIVKRDRIDVSPVFHVKEDVNYATGNITFDGTVRVDGRIEDAFSVNSAGSLFVKKSIGKCRIKVGGNLVVLGGIVGKQEADVRVGGDVFALFIEHANVTADQNMTVGELILHSDIVVGGDLEMSGTRGAIVGGTVIAGGSVSVKSIGGESTSKTHIWVGASPALVTEIRKCRADQLDCRARIAKIDEAIRAARSVRGNAGADLERQTERLESGRVQLQGHLKLLREKLQSLQQAISETSEDSVVRVMEIAMEGTQIDIGDASMVLSSPVKYATFRKVGREIRLEPYCPGH